MSQKTILTNLSFLALGLFIAYGLNQHLIGHSATGACQFVAENQNNFVAEIVLILSMAIQFFGIVYLWQNAPVLSVSTAILGFIILAYTQNDNEKLKTTHLTDAQVIKVWSSK